MKVLIADKLSSAAVSSLEKLGVDVEVRAELTAESLPEAVDGVGILVVRSTKVTAATIEAARELSLIIRAGAGFDTIDLAAACARGIYVANCPGKNTLAVAELAVGLMIAADRRIADATASMREGKWMKKEYGNARGLAGRTLGIMGYGAIGRAVAQRARALDMKIITWSPLDLTPEQAESQGVGWCDTPEELAARADAITIHMASTPETKHVIGAKFLAAMKLGAILINTSRGPLVDTDALRKAIKEKNLRVGLDVFEGEPAAADKVFADKELAAMVTCTPHIGASTDQAAEAIAAETVRIVDVFLKTGNPPGTVNIRPCPAAPCRLVARHLNRVGVLAGVLDGLRDEGINIEEIEDTIFDGAAAGCCSMLLDKKPSDKFIENLRGNPNMLSVMLNVGK